MANSTPHRRSARLSNKPAASPRSTAPKLNQFTHLGSLLERDETPEAGEHPSIDDIVNTPAPETTLREKILQLTTLKTPTTSPRPSKAEMHPKTIHQTTTKQPDSGLKFGFADISARKSAVATPSRSDPRKNLSSPTFEFKFATDSHLSNEAQTLMDNVREEAARIKAQMQIEKSAHDQKDGEAERMLSGINAAGRKIAQPKGKAGRFSDVHMAQFKRMDSIANHASAFRAKAGFAQPTQQFLKRSGSRAGLDEPERPRTAGKGTPGRPPPPFAAPSSTVSPSKSTASITALSDRPENASPAKRMRLSEFNDASTKRSQDTAGQSPSKLSTLPRPVLSNLLSPTKATLARTASVKICTAPSEKASMPPRSDSTESLKPVFEASRQAPEHQKPTPMISPSKLPRSDGTKTLRPLPPIPNPSDAEQSSLRSQSTKTVASTPKSGGFASRLPTFAGIKSILRSRRGSSRRAMVAEKPDTPKRPNTANAAIESAKKVDFTPSVKSRYAVKLAAHSPSPAKHAFASPPKTSIPEDLGSYPTEDEEDDENWEDAESEVKYPTLPSEWSEPAPVVHTFSTKAKEHNRRESKEFKSIFTTLHHPSRELHPMTLTFVNTTVNKTNPTVHTSKSMRSLNNPNLSKQSPSTIRRVRTSDTVNLIQPFEDPIKTVSHGLPAKKRRHESAIADDKLELNEDSKENRRISATPQLSSCRGESMLDEDEGEKRAGKRARIARSEEPSAKKPEVKKPSAAREAAAKNAKERKSKGILSMARLNMLSRPKARN